MTTGKDWGSEADGERSEMNPPAARPSEGAPAGAQGAREGGAGRPVQRPIDYVCHTLEVDAETRMTIELSRRPGSPYLFARARAIRGSRPPFAAVGEVTAWGVRFYARPQGAPVPSRERAVRIDWSPAFPPPIRVEEQWRSGDAG